MTALRFPGGGKCNKQNVFWGGYNPPPAAFRSFLKSAKSRFDFVILNAAPAGFCADAGMLGTLEGLTVLAARDGAFTAAELNAVMTNLAEDVRLLKGVVFTMARRTRFDAPA